MSDDWNSAVRVVGPVCLHVPGHFPIHGREGKQMIYSLEELYQNYLRMTAHLDGERMSFEEYKVARAHMFGIMAELDADSILETEANRIGF